MDVPLTSVTLLRDIASSTQNARWSEFVLRYEPMMKAFLASRFPTLEADDIVQETLLALMKVLPRYAYNPAENGYFHNYLTGILKRKALDALAAGRRVEEIRERVQRELPSSDDIAQDRDCEAWHRAVYEIALQQLLGDDEVSPRDKEIFTRMSIAGESSDTVAKTFGVTANVVYLIKSRLLKRLREIVNALNEV